MSEAVWFTLAFVAFGVVRLVIATMFFYAVLPDSDHCPVCDAPTIRVSARGWNLLLPWFRTSYCYECGWEGLLRFGPLSPESSATVPASRHQRSRSPRAGPRG